jgi:hypothetical protein
MTVLMLCLNSLYLLTHPRIIFVLVEAFIFSLAEHTKLQFPTKEDCDDVITDSSGSSVVEEGMKIW